MQSPDVLRRQKKFKGRYTAKTPPTPITIVPAVKSPSNVQHELVLYSKTARFQNMIRRKELPKSNKAQMRCVQCKKEGRKDVATKWVCMGCGYLPLCNAMTKRKMHHDCFKKYHAAKKVAIMQGQCELARQMEEVD